MSVRPSFGWLVCWLVCPHITSKTDCVAILSRLGFGDFLVNRFLAIVFFSAFFTHLICFHLTFWHLFCPSPLSYMQLYPSPFLYPFLLNFSPFPLYSCTIFNLLIFCSSFYRHFYPPHFWALTPKGAKPSHLITYGCSFRPSVRMYVYYLPCDYY
jgi:hypothetical protein